MAGFTKDPKINIKGAPRRGEIIKGQFLQDLQNGLNTFSGAITPPRQVDEPRQEKEQPEKVTNDTWTAQEITTETIRVYQEGSETVYVDIERYTQVKFKRLDGTFVTMRLIPDLEIIEG